MQTKLQQVIELCLLQQLDTPHRWGSIRRLPNALGGPLVCLRILLSGLQSNAGWHAHSASAGLLQASAHTCTGGAAFVAFAAVGLAPPEPKKLAMPRCIKITVSTGTTLRGRSITRVENRAPSALAPAGLGPRLCTCCLSTGGVFLGVMPEGLGASSCADTLQATSRAHRRRSMAACRALGGRPVACRLADSDDGVLQLSCSEAQLWACGACSARFGTNLDQALPLGADICARKLSAGLQKGQHHLPVLSTAHSGGPAAAVQQFPLSLQASLPSGLLESSGDLAVRARLPARAAISTGRL